MISLNCRSIIYSFLVTGTLIHKISKLSKRDRKCLISQDDEVVKKRSKLYINHGLINPLGIFSNKGFDESVSYLVLITNNICLSVNQNCLDQKYLKIEKAAF